MATVQQQFVPWLYGWGKTRTVLISTSQLGCQALLVRLPISFSCVQLARMPTLASSSSPGDWLPGPGWGNRYKELPRFIRKLQSIQLSYQTSMWTLTMQTMRPLAHCYDCCSWAGWNQNCSTKAIAEGLKSEALQNWHETECNHILMFSPICPKVPLLYPLKLILDKNISSNYSQLLFQVQSSIQETQQQDWGWS